MMWTSFGQIIEMSQKEVDSTPNNKYPQSPTLDKKGNNAI